MVSLEQVERGLVATENKDKGICTGTDMGMHSKDSAFVLVPLVLEQLAQIFPSGLVAECWELDQLLAGLVELHLQIQ